MKKIFLVFSAFFLLTNCRLSNVANQNFEGKLVYQIEAPGNTPDLSDSIHYQIVYAKDSMLRIDNYTPIGKQVYIEHLLRKKAYVLMDLGNEKVAIQTYSDTIAEKEDFIYSPLKGKEEIGGLKAKKINVYHTELDTNVVMSYFPEISAKYSTAHNDMPGLAVNYSIYSKGYWLKYKLISMEEKKIAVDLFGIPSDYQIITFDEFIERLQQQNDF